MQKEAIRKLLESMTVEEKLAEMTQLLPAGFGDGMPDMQTGAAVKADLSESARRSIGSVLNGTGAQNVKRLQDAQMKKNPHHIPLLFMADVIHGYRTIFPIPLAMGCSFDPEAAQEAAEIAARECSAAGVQLTFSPMADLVRDPRWGRVLESTGEDPYLNAQMAAAMVKGYQGEDYRRTGRFAKGHIAACVKHFAAYGAAEGGREYNTVDMSDGLFHEYYLPAYTAAVRAGARMVMTSFNTVERVPATVNRKLLRDILRGELGFGGVVITDYSSLAETVVHGACRDGCEAAQKGLEAGVDIEMMSTNYLRYGKGLLREFPSLEPLLNEAVLRILELKNALGLFENPYKDADEEQEKAMFLCQKHRAAARRISAEAAVLLKNSKNVLPLREGVKIGIAGPFTASRNVIGGWAYTKDGGVSLYDGIRQNHPAAVIKTAMTDELGSMFDGCFDVEDRVQEACEALRDCDVLLAAVGENQTDTAEGASKSDLRLSPNQRKLVAKLKELGKPLVLVVFSGRPMELAQEARQADAVLQAWFLGTESGNALSDLLFGEVNPSGRLSMSFPQNVGQIPVYYNSFATGRPYLSGKQEDRFFSRYLDCPNEPLYPFGHGLSYSSFSYSDLRVEQGDALNVSAAVENTSDVPGMETVQFYIHDVAASTVRPVMELKGLRRVPLAPHEKRTVTFPVTREMLKFCDSNSALVFEPGAFDFMIGHDSMHVLKKRVTVE